jgi:polyisoprenoid-binding protein YceI
MRQAFIVLVWCVLGAPAQADEWRSSAASQFGFVTTIETVATPGVFKRFLVLFCFDPSQPSEAWLRVTVDLTAADLGDPDMNAVLADPAWFDTGHFAEAVFDSHSIVEQAPGEYVANGTLDLKGVQKNLAVPFAWTSAGDTASMAGELLLDRSEFDVGSGEWASGDTIGIAVQLKFAIQLERQH